MDIRFIGKSIVFPIQLENGKAKVETGVELIRRSIETILRWESPRFFLGEFRCRLTELLEEPNDTIVKSLVRHFILDSLKTFEKRIELLEVRVIDIDDKSINVSIYYRIISNQSEDNFIFPFYRKIKY